MRRLLAILSCLILLSTVLPFGTAFASTETNSNSGSGNTQAMQSSATDERYFSETGFRISNDKFWDYFQKRGGTRTFGYPVSRDFTLSGTTVQIFQRRILQLNADGSVGQLNLFDNGLMPYKTINFTTIPSVDDALVASAPAATSADYATTVLSFVKAHTPDTWQSLSVNYNNTYNDSVKASEAFPSGGSNSGLMSLINFEMWGIPTSQAAADPNNANFVYLRFQRGVMHYDKGTGLTQGLLLADYFKSIITGTNLPADLDAAATTSPYYKQYNNTKADGMNNPAALPGSNMKDAFEKQTPTATMTTTTTTGLRYGMQAHMWFQDQGKILNMITGAGFGWVKQQIKWADLEPTRGAVDWAAIDAVVNNSYNAGVKVLFSVVSSPTWSRADGRTDGPPDNYSDYANFVASLASRYKGKVAAYEIWNEQNFSREWGGGTINAAQYVQLLKTTYAAVKAADPSCVVISGALTPTGVNDTSIAVDDVTFLSQMYAAGLKDSCDAVGAHMAGYNNAPGDWTDVNTVNTTGFKGHGSFYYRRIDQLHDVMTQYGDSKQMWITEYEWAAVTGSVPAGYEWAKDLTEDQVASFYVQGIQMIQSSRSWVGAVFIWNLNWRTFADPATNECAIFGILNADWTPRAIYTALKNMAK